MTFRRRRLRRPIQPRWRLGRARDPSRVGRPRRPGTGPMVPARFPRPVASAARRSRTKRRRRERPMRLGSRPPARVRPSRAIQAKGRPLWRVGGDPRTGRRRQRRQRLPLRSRDRSRLPPPPRLPGSRRHLALRRPPISAPPRSGPHLPPTASPPPGRTHGRPADANRAPRPLHRGPGSATRRPPGSGVGESRRPRRRLLPLRRPPRTRRARASRLTSGRAARRSQLASSLRTLAGRRTPLGPPRDPASTGRPARHRRHCRPGRPRLRLPAPVSSPDRFRATMSRSALATRRRPGPLGPGRRVPAGRMSALQPLGPPTDPRPPSPGTPFATTWRLRRLRRPALPPVGPWTRRRLGRPSGPGLRSPETPAAGPWMRHRLDPSNDPLHPSPAEQPAGMWTRRRRSGPATHERVAWSTRRTFRPCIRPAGRRVGM
jgi:hypothetical protein